MVRAHMRGCAVAMIIRNRIANNTVRPVTVCNVFCDPSCSGFLLKEPGIRCAILASSTKMFIFLYILLENYQKHGVLIKNSHCTRRIFFLQTPEILVYRKATYDDNSLHHAIVKLLKLRSLATWQRPRRIRADSCMWSSTWFVGWLKK